MILVELGTPYFPDPTIGRPVYNGSIYIGEPDTDPEIVGNQKTVYYRQEDGTEIAAAQPIRTGAGGVPLYNGSPVQILVNGDYSIKVLNQLGAQAYYIPSNTGSEPIVVQTISDLRSLEPISGYAVNLLGYYSPGDGGGGPIRVAKTGAAPGTYVDNGGSIIVPTGGNGSAAWVWEWSGAINVKWFGAKGDGVTDDTAAIAAAFASGKDVYIPEGTYLVDLNAGVGVNLVDQRIFGDGPERTILQKATDDTGHLLFSSNLAGNVCFSNLQFKGISGSVSTYQMVEMRRKSNLTFDNCYFYDVNGSSQALLYLDGCGKSGGGYKNTIRDCVFDGLFYGVNERTSANVADNPYGGSLHVERCVFKNSRPAVAGVSIGIQVGTNPASGVRTFDYNFSNNRFEETLEDTAIFVGGGVLKNVLIHGNKGRVQQAGLWVFSSDYNNPIENVVITGNQIESEVDFSIGATRAKNFTIASNVTGQSGYEAIRVESSIKGSITNNIVTNTGTRSTPGRLHGILLTDSSASEPCNDVSVNGNTISNVPEYGIAFDGFTGSGTAVGNTFENIGESGLVSIIQGRFFEGTIENTPNVAFWDVVDAGSSAPAFSITSIKQHNFLCFYTALDLSNIVGGTPSSEIRLRIWHQVGAGLSITWPTVKWVGGVAPTAPGTGNELIVNLIYERNASGTGSGYVLREISRTVVPH